MYISSRAAGRTEKFYKNSFWKRFFSIKLARRLFPKLNERVQYEKVVDSKLLSWDLVEIDEEEYIFQNKLGSEASVYYLKEEIQDDLEPLEKT
jgi:hypothetical protein